MKRYSKILVCALSIFFVVALTVLPSFCAPALLEDNFTTWDMLTSAQMENASEYFGSNFSDDYLEEWSDSNLYQYYYGSVLIEHTGFSNVSCDPFVSTNINYYTEIQVLPYCYFNLSTPSGTSYRFFSKLTFWFAPTVNYYQIRFYDLENLSHYLYMYVEFSTTTNSYHITDLYLYDGGYSTVQSMTRSFSLQLDYSNFAPNPYSYRLYGLLLTLLTGNSDVSSIPSFVFNRRNFLSELESINSYISSSYNLGHSDGYDTGFDLGYGMGYNEGKVDGFGEGYDEGNLDGFLDGYEQGHNNGYSDGYDDGYEVGHNVGFSAGYSLGSEEGFDDGQEYGYELGFRVGKTEGLEIADIGTLPEAINAAVTAPASVLTSILDFDILGINMFGFLGSILAVCLVVVIIKLVKK